MATYTKSVDGEFRCTLWANVRLTQEEECEVHELAKRRGVTVREFLNMCLRGGLDHELAAED